MSGGERAGGAAGAGGGAGAGGAAGAGGVAGMRVLVAGGGTGIGRAIALGLAAAGARVVVGGRRPEPLAEVVATAAGADVSALALDVAARDSVDAAVEQAVARLGGLDGLVNAAGVHSVAPSDRLGDETLHEVLNINLVGAFRLSRAVAPHLRAAGGGAIVQIASLSSFGGFPGRLAYGVSKAGLVQLVQTLAAEWGRDGIRVNALVPGFVRTPISDRLVAEGRLDLDELNRRTPLGRRAESGDMVGPALFLLSGGPDGAGFVSGQSLVADGGWLSWVGPTANAFPDAAPPGDAPPIATAPAAPDGRA